MDLKIVRFVHLNDYLTGVFMFKWENALLPSIFDDYFVYNSSVHSYDTRMCNALHVTMVKSNLGKELISFKGVLGFNELLKQQFDFNCSLPTIKYKIKTALLIKNYV